MSVWRTLPLKALATNDRRRNRRGLGYGQRSRTRIASSRGAKQHGQYCMATNKLAWSVGAPPRNLLHSCALIPWGKIFIMSSASQNFFFGDEMDGASLSWCLARWLLLERQMSTGTNVSKAKQGQIKVATPRTILQERDR